MRQLRATMRQVPELLRSLRQRCRLHAGPAPAEGTSRQRSPGFHRRHRRTDGRCALAQAVLEWQGLPRHAPSACERIPRDECTPLTVSRPCDRVRGFSNSGAISVRCRFLHDVPVQSSLHGSTMQHASTHTHQLASAATWLDKVPLTIRELQHFTSCMAVPRESPCSGRCMLHRGR